MPASGYSGSYQRKLAGLRSGPPMLCAHCKRQVATTLDHNPPLAMHVHRPDTGCCTLLPSCEACNRRGGEMVANGTWRPRATLADVEREPERGGLEAGDDRWAVPWLEALRDLPADAVWPRLMTVPHPAAAGSLGAEFVAWAEAREGRALRWWQRLVATRLLEVDAGERLLWETLVLSTARQVGKSWLLRELAMWRIEQTPRFGEPQDVLHTGKDMAVCLEVQRPARVWCKARHDGLYRVREANGQVEIEHTPDGSRWLLRAKEAVYGYSVSLAVVDEAWKVRSSSVDEGLTPTMAEREQPQLLLVSTAHRKATKLMLEARHVALNALEDPGSDLLVEWSAPAGAEMDDPSSWRQASPHWTSRRRGLIGKALERAQAGEIEDPEEPDPEQSFRAQWLNQWPRKLAEPTGATEPLLAPGVWAELAEPVTSTSPLYVALEDDYGLGAAVAAARRTPDGRLEVDGWLRGDWDTAIADLEALADSAPVRVVLIGASLLDRVPAPWRGRAKPCGSAETRTGLALFRDLAMTGQLVHDTTTDVLDETLGAAVVREAPTGLVLMAKGPTHLVRAMVWAVSAAHRPAPAPAVH
jgi:hypothetical protein